MTRTLTETGALPERPRIVPGLDVLERGEGELQIGLERRHAVVLDTLSPMLMDLVRGLDGSRSTGTLMQLARSQCTSDEEAEKAADDLRLVLEGLAERGLIEESDAPAHARSLRTDEPALWTLTRSRPRRSAAARWAQSTVLLQGGGRLAAGLARTLATAGIGHIDAHADGRVGPEDLGTGFVDADIGTPRRQAITNLVKRTNSATKTGKVRGKQRPDLVVLTDTVVPAPEIVNELMVERQPHLLVRVRDGNGLVGPLVHPGRSSCLRCADLAHTARDPSWPRVASQLAGRLPRTDLCSVTATAGMAGGQILRILDPEESVPPTWNGTIEVDAFAGTTTTSEAAPHPSCPCGAASVGQAVARQQSAGPDGDAAAP
ncbi:bacteriocin biosynthesis cyclodehydratase domain-containing protein [Prauserella sediminis]|uniref:Bacteriocin biosynthesis cyclodehydratase domain-containing protein n=1 Tax=Prauserella sediminis TaxID=577680 RepID=A0A839XGZ2_9PSEU|nr:ThiF family adenylyltransferase [Prauserella sediminis]MBB3661747.1 bacteriocin biosynthesis cyclodehydratase domain-containing protein [Prauserella sediminis]